MKQETVIDTVTVTDTASEAMEPIGVPEGPITVDEDGVLVEEPDEGTQGVTLPLERSKFTADGRTYYYYHVKVKVFGKVQELELRPKANDRNAYFTLQGIFGDQDQVPLHCTQASRPQEGSTRRQKYMVYTVEGVDPDSGLVFTVALVPFGDTSKRTLEAMYRKLAAEQ